MKNNPTNNFYFTIHKRDYEYVPLAQDGYFHLVQEGNMDKMLTSNDVPYSYLTVEDAKDERKSLEEILGIKLVIVSWEIHPYDK